VTRERPKVDRIACPWFIRRFVDPTALFMFVAPSEIAAVAAAFGATPVDVEGVFWSHRGERCTFDAMLEEFGLGTPALLRLATIVRAADIGFSIWRQKRPASSLPRLAYLACMRTILNGSKPEWRFTTRSTAGAATPLTKHIIGPPIKRRPRVSHGDFDPGDSSLRRLRAVARVRRVRADRQSLRRKLRKE
jgi:hypothetical protein